MTRLAWRIVIGALFLAVATAIPAIAAEQERSRIVIATLGPNNLSYLPIDLIPKIGADRAEGVELRLHYYAGGAVALQQLLGRNADFAVAGVPAVMSARRSGGNPSAVAVIDDAPLFVLMVRTELRDQIRTPADLRGRVIGATTSSPNAKTTSHQIVRLLLAKAGVPLDTVRIVAAGQNYAEQAAMVTSGAVDAIIGLEPVASRLRHEGKVFFLVNLADPDSAALLPGRNFLHAILATREDLVATAPDKVARAVRMVKRSLDWVATHTPEQIVDALAIADADERDHLLDALKTHRNVYSRDGAFAAEQIRDTAILYAAANAIPLADAQKMLDSSLVDKWVGRR